MRFESFNDTLNSTKIIKIIIGYEEFETCYMNKFLDILATKVQRELCQDIKKEIIKDKKIVKKLKNKIYKNLNINKVRD